MLGMFADMLRGTELEPLQAHLCKFSRPSVPLQLCIKFTITEQKRNHPRAAALYWIVSQVSGPTRSQLTARTEDKFLSLITFTAIGMHGSGQPGFSLKRKPALHISRIRALLY